MGPIYSRDHFINAHPGNLLVGCRVLSDLLYRGLVFSDGDVALHALGGVRKSHELARLGIGVALLAFQTESEMLLVTVRDGLFRRRVRAWIVRHLIFFADMLSADGLWFCAPPVVRPDDCCATSRVAMQSSASSVKATSTDAVDLFLSMNSTPP